MRTLSIDDALDRDLVSRPLREAYGETLIELAESGADFVVLDADLSRSTTTDQFQRRFPERFFNMGISEQNMVGHAAGLAISGLTPFVTTYAIFIGRAFDQIRQSVSYPKLNVKIVGSHAGLAASFDGGSHQGIEDIALMRVLPDMSVLVPFDFEHAKAAIKYAFEMKGPCYIRLQKEATPIFTSNAVAPAFTSLMQWGGGKDLAFVATGYITYECLLAARALRDKGVNARVVSVGMIKPFPEKALAAAVHGCKRIISVEEHLSVGGLHDAIAVALAGSTPLTQVAIRDRYGETGPWRDLLDRFGLTAKRLYELATELCANQPERDRIGF